MLQCNDMPQSVLLRCNKGVFIDVFQIFISKSYDATTHFETCCKDIMAMYERIVGEKLDLCSLSYNTEAEH